MSAEANELLESQSQEHKLYKKLVEHEKYIAYLQGKVAHADKTILEHRLEAEKCRQENSVLQIRLKELESENTTLCNQIAQNRDIVAKCGAIASRFERDNEKRRKNNREANERKRKRKQQQAELTQLGIEDRPPKRDPFGFNRLIWSNNKEECEQKHLGPSTISQLPRALLPSQLQSALLPTPDIPPLFSKNLKEYPGQHLYIHRNNSHQSTSLLPKPTFPPLLTSKFSNSNASSSTTLINISLSKETGSPSPTEVEIIY